jgi:hypothetical protein
MTKRAFSFVTFYLVLFLFALASCTQQRSPCYEPKIVSVAIGTYRMVDTTSVDTTLPYPAFACLDTNLMQERTPTNNFSALLSPLVDSTRWILAPDSVTTTDQVDTITFYHTKSLNFISNACGYVYYFTLSSVRTTYNSIDSISLTNTSVDNNANTQHLRIYY